VTRERQRPTEMSKVSKTGFRNEGDFWERNFCRVTAVILKRKKKRPRVTRPQPEGSAIDPRGSPQFLRDEPWSIGLGTGGR
jgi:hypothetical protein